LPFRVRVCFGDGYKLPQRHIHAHSIMWKPGRKGGN
jgi:hypothetical protein